MNKPDPIPARLAALKTTPTPDLKKQWRDLFDSEPPPFNRRYLESRLAYRIQELAYGGLKPETIRRLERLGEAREQIAQAALLAPRDPAVGLEAGVIAALSGREQEARRSFESVLLVAPDSDEAKRARGYLEQLQS